MLLLLLLGGATDACRDNVAAAYPVMSALTQSASGRQLLQQALRLCSPVQPYDGPALVSYWQDPWFYLAEGDYPFPSTYITYRWVGVV